MRKFLLLGNLVFMFSGSSYNYQVEQEGGRIRILSPYGEKVFFGDLSFQDEDNYQIKIPIARFREYFNKSIDKSSSAKKNKDNPALSVDKKETLFKNANQYFYQNDLKTSLLYVEEILHRFPQNIRALLMKGSIQHSKGNKAQALKTWALASDIDPHNPEINQLIKDSL